MIESLQGPILVLGASGFIGANLFKRLLNVRQDVYGTCFSQYGRLKDMPNVLEVKDPRYTLCQIVPATVFDLITYGAYSFEEDTDRIYNTNVILKHQLMEQLHALNARLNNVNATLAAENAQLANENIKFVATVKEVIESMTDLQGQIRKFV